MTRCFRWTTCNTINSKKETKIFQNIVFEKKFFFLNLHFYNLKTKHLLVGLVSFGVMVSLNVTVDFVASFDCVELFSDGVLDGSALIEK